MAVFTAIVLAAFLFEDDNFVVFDVIDDFSRNESARKVGSADFGFAVAADEHDFFDFNSVAFFGVQQVHAQDIVLLNAILLTTGFNDCVHNYDRFISSVYHES